jgi:hypothetical protein
MAFLIKFIAAFSGMTLFDPANHRGASIIIFLTKKRFSAEVEAEDFI